MGKLFTDREIKAYKRKIAMGAYEVEYTPFGQLKFGVETKPADSMDYIKLIISRRVLVNDYVRKKFKEVRPQDIVIMLEANVSIPLTLAVNEDDLIPVTMYLQQKIYGEFEVVDQGEEVAGADEYLASESGLLTIKLATLVL